jgi:hypothetical protein
MALSLSSEAFAWHELATEHSRYDNRGSGKFGLHIRPSTCPPTRDAADEIEIGRSDGGDNDDTQT